MARTRKTSKEALEEKIEKAEILSAVVKVGGHMRRS